MVKLGFSAVLHQPWRIRKFNFLEIGQGKNYFDEELNKSLFKRISRKSYLPTLKIMTELAEDHKDFRINLSFTGSFLDQAERYRPKVLTALKELNKTGALEIAAETYYHSLAFLVSAGEFDAQVKLHLKKMKELFNVRPVIFRNTESFYNNDVAKAAERLGFKGIITEGSEKFLGWRSPGHPYRADGTKLMLLLRNYRMSDDIGFRFSAPMWEEYPLTADKYASWMSAVSDPYVMIYIDFETFGEHHWPETGIMEFLRHLPSEMSKYSNVSWVKLSELLKLKPVDSLDIPWFVSWADVDRDLSAWLGNRMQQSAFNSHKSLEADVKKTADPELLETWRKLGTSDHFYYMSTKFAGDEEVHNYFRCEVYSSPYEAFSNYMNILQDFKLAVKNKLARVK
ncbi:MAG: alpha-amylase [Candidatus Altiarchaeota archaeon]|nr:alpha-amylase [Candidatus Altiarchaeota archaeon]